MSRRAVLWVAFAVVHVAIAWLGFVLPSEPMGDVYRVYEPWSQCAFSGGGVFCPGGPEIMGITVAWVYPQLALLPMMLAHAFAWIAGYEIAWALLVTALDALAFAVLVGSGRSRGRTSAAWYWLAFAAALGPVGMYRLDALTVPLVLVGALLLVGRPWLGSVLLAVATWIKVWPAAVLAAAVLAVRRRGAVIGAAAAVSAAVLLVVVLAGGASHAFGFVTDQAGRGLQIEAPVSDVYLWQVVAGVAGASIYYDPDMLTFQVTGANVDTVIAVMTPVLAVAVLAVFALGALQAWRGARFVSLFPATALALVLAFIVFNKVGSPQYLSWIIAPLLIALVLDRRRWRGPAVLALIAAGMTQLVYPILYDSLLAASPVAVVVLTLRNVLLIALLAWTIAILVARPVVPASDASGRRRAAPTSLVP